MKASIRQQIERKISEYQKRFPGTGKEKWRDLAMVEVGLDIAQKQMWEEALLHNYEMVYVDENDKIIRGKARDIYPEPKKKKRAPQRKKNFRKK